MERSFVPRSRKRGVQSIFPLQFFVFVHGFVPVVSSTFSCDYAISGYRLSECAFHFHGLSMLRAYLFQ